MLSITQLSAASVRRKPCRAMLIRTLQLAGLQHPEQPGGRAARPLAMSSKDQESAASRASNVNQAKIDTRKSFRRDDVREGQYAHGTRKNSKKGSALTRRWIPDQGRNHQRNRSMPCCRCWNRCRLRAAPGTAGALSQTISQSKRTSPVAARKRVGMLRVPAGQIDDGPFRCAAPEENR